MLVLSRKAGEVIRVGDSVEITVLEIRGERIRVGLAAPPDVKIRRQELPAHPARRERISDPSREYAAPWREHRRDGLKVIND